MDLGLELEGAAPAAVLDEDANAPDGGDEKGDKSEQRRHIAEHFVEAGAVVLLVDHIGPDGTLEGLVGAARPAEAGG